MVRRIRRFTCACEQAIVYEFFQEGVPSRFCDVDVRAHYLFQEVCVGDEDFAFVSDVEAKNVTVFFHEFRAVVEEGWNNGKNRIYLDKISTFFS